ncbi:MAG: ABC transporter permease [Anaerolineales bacterium]|nr:ABC transporter permease [Anaerolineales bacterium]
MMRIFDIAAKDILQLARDRKVFLFLLIMPVIFTLLFGYASGGFGGSDADARLPVGYLDEDGSWLSCSLHDLLSESQVMRLDEFGWRSLAELEWAVADEKLAAAIVVPSGYGHALLHGKPARLILVADTALPAGMSIESEALTAVIRLESAARIALIVERVASQQIPFDYAFREALSAWEEPPIRVEETTSTAIESGDNNNSALAHTSPGMMLQFAIAGLLTSAQIMVDERKSRSLQRMLTTATPRIDILLGHYLAIFVMIFGQFITLIAFGQLLLKVNYWSAPLATLLVALGAASCIAALGLLIGALAGSEEQAVVFSLVPMFVLAGLGGAWVPLEVAGEAFQVIGHLSPVAWAMDGFKNISIRGLGVEAVLLPCAALAGYAVLFFSLAVWRFSTAGER